jgi:hypothetical protein
MDGEKMKRSIGLIILCMLLVIVLAGCNMPTEDAVSNGNTNVPSEQSDQPDNGDSAGDDSNSQEDTSSSEEPAEETATQEPSATPESKTATPEDQVADGNDLAEFITDVTIPDYSEVEVGEDITKTWRIRNAGTTTWTTGYVIEFEKGEKLGASTQISLSKEVKPGQMIDISIDFKVPSARGEYSSYWIIKNEENERLGTTGEGKFFELFMIITAVDDAGGGDGGDGGSSGGSSIPGGAKVSGVTVTVSPTNYTGSCPASIDIDYTVTTSNAGKVKFNLVFNVISPSGFTFDPPPQYEVSFNSGYTVYYDYLFLPSNSVTATVRVQAVGSNEVLSTPVQFAVKCD